MRYLRKNQAQIIFVVTVFIGFVFAKSALGIATPAAVYCKELGYEWFVEKIEGGEIGICKFPDGTTAGQWDFLKGKSGQKWSYCEKKGYELKILSDSDECLSIYSRDCAVCVLEHGVEREVSKLVKAEKEIPGCGNDVCNSPKENFGNCPQDCFSGSKDGYCDKVRDGICDPDCRLEEDLDCKKKLPSLLYIAIPLVMILLGFLIYKGIKKWREKRAINPEL